MKYNFYYDETEHSQKMSFPTFSAENYSDTFITVFIGYPEKFQISKEKEYLNFEQKYKNRFSQGELKSKTFNNKLFKFGFASLDNKNIELINDFLNLFDDNIKIVITSVSKIEYVLNQILINNAVNNKFKYNKNALLYTISKAIDCYKPQKLLKSILDDNTNNNIQIKNFIEFFNQRIVFNSSINELKGFETNAFLAARLLLQNTESIKIKAWNYQKSFEIFNTYLQNECIKDFNLYLDQEGSGNTEIAAKYIGFPNVISVDSKNCFGIRMSDMLAGLINKLLRAIKKELDYDLANKHIERKLISEKWFKLNKDQLNLYKKLFKVINKASFVYSIYGDRAIYFINFIDFTNNLPLADYSKTYDTRSVVNKEKFNSIVCSQLAFYFTKLEEIKFW